MRGRAGRPLNCDERGCRYVLDGVRRMRERPILDLVAGLRQLGADVRMLLGTSGPPVEVNAKGGLPGGKVRQAEGRRS